MKSHLKFTKSQQRGVFFLILLVVILQGIYFYIDFSTEKASINIAQLEDFQQEVDSLRAVEIEKNKPKVFPFNPNYITDHKGYTLGMSIEEIDRLHAYRGKNKWVNSAKDFQQVTKVSDSLLAIISPFFKFPEWVTNPKPRSTTFTFNKDRKLTYAQKTDLNKATADQLQKVNGIGKTLSERIIKYRNKFVGGFISDIQLNDVYGLTPEVVERTRDQFTVKTPRQIQKLILNKASIEELVTVQHIDYDLAYEIVDQRTLRNGFKSIDELTKVKDFPSNKIEIIRLYLILD
ncbi:MAG: helix-hairpin-helix domain-containing protein [Flavobacteriaceae bacterium]|nr:helix-hairpin-helix domain-containing protein [Flavobacteriaceae bacterium]